MLMDQEILHKKPRCQFMIKKTDLIMRSVFLVIRGYFHSPVYAVRSGFGFELIFADTAGRAGPVFRQFGERDFFNFFVINMTADNAYVFHC